MPAQRLTSKLVPRVWGSTSLTPYFPNSTEKIGEVWFETIPGIPLLLKFIFTTEKLSVQVHPPDAYAREHENSLGKTEMWHVLAAEPGAKIAAGFREPISETQLREAALSGDIMNLLAWQEAHPGDTYFIPAGTVHAIGEGLTMCEIQQESDVTYRLYDYGRNRPLHLDHAVRISNRTPIQALQPVREGIVVSCPYFTTEKVQLRGSLEAASDLWIVLGGSGRIGGQIMQAGEAWHVADPVPLEGNATLLHVTR